MKILEDCGVTINKKTATRLIGELIISYINFDDEAGLLANYIGKTTGSALKKLKVTVFEQLDLIGGSGKA